VGKRGLSTKRTHRAAWEEGERKKRRRKEDIFVNGKGEKRGLGKQGRKREAEGVCSILN